MLSQNYSRNAIPTSNLFEHFDLHVTYDVQINNSKQKCRKTNRRFGSLDKINRFKLDHFTLITI